MPIFRYFATNLSASTHVRFFSLSLHRRLFLLVPRLLFQPLVQLRFSEELFIAIPHRDSPSLPLYSSLKKQFIRLFVFRFDVPRGLFRFLSIVLLLPLLPSIPRCPRHFQQRVAYTSQLFSDSTFVERTLTPNAVNLSFSFYLCFQISLPFSRLLQFNLCNKTNVTLLKINNLKSSLESE